MINLEKNLSIVIVNYNSGEFLLRCLKSLEQIKEELNFCVWIVDNASTDDSLPKARRSPLKLQIIKNDDNLGFGKANNIAIRKIDTEYILLLNPDCEVLTGTLKYMMKFMKENPQVGVATCAVEKQDGSLDLASHRGFPTPWASFLYYFLGDDNLYHLTSEDMKKKHEIDAISGAFFMTKNSVLLKVGLFDEDYFLYGEDLDLCYRIKQAGFKIMYVPEVKIIHHKGITSGIKKHSQLLTTSNIESRKRALDYFYQTMKIFYQKHYAREYPFFINWLIFLGINIKWALAKTRMSV